MPFCWPLPLKAAERQDKHPCAGNGTVPLTHLSLPLQGSNHRGAVNTERQGPPSNRRPAIAQSSEHRTAGATQQPSPSHCEAVNTERQGPPSNQRKQAMEVKSVLLTHLLMPLNGSMVAAEPIWLLLLVLLLDSSVLHSLVQSLGLLLHVPAPL